MHAREKLNAAHLYGALLVAALVGALCESWLVFLIVTGGLVAAAIHSGQIRPNLK